jgi:hypothetical protein
VSPRKRGDNDGLQKFLEQSAETRETRLKAKCRALLEELDTYLQALASVREQSPDEDSTVLEALNDIYHWVQEG